MGGAGDNSQRSSSPLKRRASDLEDKPTTSLNDDVDMDAPASPESLEDKQEEPVIEEDTPVLSANKGKSEDSGTVSVATHSQEIRQDIPSSDVLPSIDEQIQTVTRILESSNKVPLEAGEKAYAISNKWLKRVQERSSTAKTTDDSILEEEIGPIDNSDIFQEILQDGDGELFVRLRPGLARAEFEWFPEEAWQYVFGLYGLKDGQVPIARKTINTNPDIDGIPNIEYERDPPLFIIHRLWSANSPVPLPQLLKAQNPKAPIFVFSRNDLYVDLLRRIKTASSIEMSTKIRLWKVPRNFGGQKSIAASIANETSPPASRGNTPSSGTRPEPQDSWTHLLVDVETFLKLEKGAQRMIVQHEDKSMTEYKGSMTVGMANLEVEQALIIDERVESDFLSQYVPKVKKSNVATSTTRGGVTTIKSTSDSGRASPAPSGPMTRGRAQRSDRTIGTVGLSNLGNTCYMNSALQCVRSVEELTKYFLTKEATEEINRDNPLGNNGQVADAYNDLLLQIYRDPPQGTVVPRQFKTTIGRIVPSFSGYGQQDSQEFLGFLLDGLQEDLSRIKKKPYIEKPDSTDEMVGNPDAIREMAAKVWDITKKRDDSVIADLFTGMYKSTLVCPVCDKVSITFDPFNNLTLQLPIENTWTHEIFFFPLNDRPIKINVDMDKQGSIKGLKEFVSQRTNVPVERLFIGEEFKCRFYKFYDDMKPVSEEIQSNDMIALYELESVPTNWPPPKKPIKQKSKSMLTFSHFDSNDEDEVPNWNDPMAERMLVPVLHRNPGPENPRFRKPWSHAIVPHFIIVNASEARNEDAIRRKLLEKVATFTTNPEFHREDEDEEEEEDVNDSADQDLLVTTSSDADSAGDSKVVATSVDGDEDLVDVKMKESQDLRESIESDAGGSGSLSSDQKSESRKGKFRTRRPKWVDPKVYLRPEFQNLFNICYFTGSKELVPVGWGAVDEDKSYPLISSRIPAVPQETSDDDEYQEQAQSFSRRTPSETGSSDVEEDDAPQLAPTRMTEESDSENELAPTSVSRALPVRPIAQRVGVKVGYNRRRNRGLKTYSRKGMKLASDRQSLDDSADDTQEEGPLIRLGEGIVVDWNREAYEALFGGHEDDMMSGAPTWTKLDILDDPELAAKRSARMNRKKKGLSLDECLDEFGKEEILSEMDTWYCPRCKEHRRASKKFELWKTPDILVMHLKRFSSNAMRRDKLDVMVDFPIEGLDLTSRVVEKEDGKQEIYDLFAVDDHWGGLGGGHYTAFAKSWVDNEWYEYNDSSVSKQKDTSRIVSHGAYLLFYRRRSEGPLGGPRFQRISDLYNKSLEESDDESAESGEGQRLVGDSSPHGSSSALTGVGAVHQQTGGFQGGAQMTRSQAMPMSSMMHSVEAGPPTTINPADLDKPPAYELRQNDTIPLLSRDEEMNDRDADEGVDVTMGYNKFDHSRDSIQQSNMLMTSSWNFESLAGMGTTHSKMANQSGADSDIELNGISDRSDIAAHNSSATDGSLAERLNDFANAEPDEGDWEQPDPIPDMSDEAQAAIYGLHEDLLNAGQNAKLSTKGLNQVLPESIREDLEEEAAEIRIDEGEGLKID